MAILARGSTVYSRVVGRLPWWLSVLVGLACVVLGALLTFRPFGSLAALIVLLTIGLIVNGVSELLRADRPLAAVVSGVVWIIAGVLALVLPGLTIGALTVVVGVALIVSGVTGVIRAARGDSDQRVADLMLATASVILGVLALAWRDVTVFVVAAIFGVRLVVFGIDQIVAAARRARGIAPVSPPVSRTLWRQWLRTGTAAIAVLATAGLLLLSVQLSGTPRPDAFYDAPATVPDEPGQLLRAERFTRTIPAGATAWRILYTTTLDEGRAAIASALVVVPTAGDRHPVIAWAHGTTGFATGCAPSLLEEPFVSMPNFDAALNAGWAVVATDYTGLGTSGAQPYLVGQGEGRNVLDSIRAAHQLADADLAQETVIWSHSQGGHAALWAGGLAPTYAPDIDLLGVAAIAPASNLPALFTSGSGSAAGSLIGSFALAAYAAEYPEITADDYVRPGARLMVTSMQQRCLTDPSTLISVATAVFGNAPAWSKNPGEGAFGRRAEENVPTLKIRVPLLLAQGDADTLIIPETQDDYVADRCSAGQAVDYRTYPGKDHMGVITGASPLLADLLRWTEDRFAGAPSASTCP